MTKTLKKIIDSKSDIEYDIIVKWLNKQNIYKISEYLKEPKRMLSHRLKSFEIFNEMELPTRWPNLDKINFDDIIYYAKPKNSWTYSTNWDDIPQNLKDKFYKLWIPEAEQKYLAWAWWQMDSEMIYHKVKKKRAEKWVIFEDMNVALKKYENIVRKYFMKLIPATDHKFAALHGAVWSWWTFIYIPKWVEVSDPLQTYFRMNTEFGWQFEHTLIILEKNSMGSYIEWCSAPKYQSPSIHAWWVEIFVGENSHMKYSSVENWSQNTYNLNTKRAVAEKNSYIEWVWWNLWSWATMLYPCSILKWDNSKSEHIWVAIANKWQNQDVWAKVIHIWKQTSSNIVSKSISKDWGISRYRWLVKISSSAKNSINSTECDAMLLDDLSVSDTIPNIITDNHSSIISHEATAWKIDENKIFYLQSKWISKEKAMSMIINGFISPVLKKLPLEYAWELNRLIEMEIEWF